MSPISVTAEEFQALLDLTQERFKARIAELEAERDRLKGQLCEWCAQGAPRDELVSDKHRIPSHSGHGWEYPACGLFRSPGARITELETERDALNDKCARLDKLVELGIISLGNACEERDRLKHSDRALRKEIAALRKALEDAPHERYCLSEWERNMFRRKEPQPNACDCWKARIPQPTLDALAQGGRPPAAAGNT